MSLRAIAKQSQKAIFLDRDGVINKNIDYGYVTKWEEFIFLPDSKEAIKLLTQEGFRIFVISNQAAVNKGIISWDKLNEITEKMCKEIEEYGGKIEKVYYCPHRSDENCSCRKPKPGLLIKAAEENNVNLSTSFFVGDSRDDVQCATLANCHSVIVFTGREKKIDTTEWEYKPEVVFNDIFSAANYLVEKYV